ncbi:replication protein A2 isoform X3 [Tachypleus tridentatus]|uniref:replication protein A2 isoform X3 n=1 Tax=Tachypleus tridentatus TaxID=6853 RepID=UPI003FD03372
MWNTNMDQHSFDQTGGGFLNSSGNFGSPAIGSPNEKRKSERLHNVVPVTVAQVLQASDKEEHLTVGSMECHILTLVGLVRFVDEQTIRITYQLDDFTGSPLEVQMWFGENENVQAISTAGFLAKSLDNTQMGMNVSGGAILEDVGNMFGLDRNQQLVFRAISAATSEEGISFQHLCESLKSLTPAVIRKVVEFLSNEGHIYTTTDDDHYKATDSG